MRNMFWENDKSPCVPQGLRDRAHEQDLKRQHEKVFSGMGLSRTLKNICIYL